MIVPLSAQAGDAGASRSEAPFVVMAQYDGPPMGPGGYDGPGGYGYGGGYDMPPGPEEGFGPGGPGYRPYSGRGHARSARSGPTRSLSYHGFRIELSGAPGGAFESEVAAVEHQIDIVDSAGLSMSDLRLFRGMPIRTKNGGRGGPGHYGGGSTVEIGTLNASDSRPVLLHEYMHVLHAKRLPGGYSNSTIRHFYQEAVSNNLYEQGSFMLTNPGEFFAVTASCYLYGTVAREPYNRDAIRAKQPDYYAYLEQLFGRARSSGRALAPSKLHAASLPPRFNVAPGLRPVGG